MAGLQPVPKSYWYRLRIEAKLWDLPKSGPKDQPAAFHQHPCAEQNLALMSLR